MKKHSIYSILKDNYIKIFGEQQAHFYLNIYWSKCLEEIMPIVHENKSKYQISNNQSGLYVKSENNNNPCFVVAGGTSLKKFKFDQLKDKTTFVSNKSIFDVPNANYFITTDYTFINYLKKKNLYKKWKDNEADKYFVVNCISDVIQNINGQIKDTRYDLEYELQDFNKIIICKSAKDIGFTFDNFNSGYNSGFCSFQLALLMGHNPIYLLGMDMNCDVETHYHEGYGRSEKKMQENLSNYKKHFISVLKKLKTIQPELKVISCSKKSSLNEVIEYKNVKDVL